MANENEPNTVVVGGDSNSAVENSGRLGDDTSGDGGNVDTNSEPRNPAEGIEKRKRGRPPGSGKSRNVNGEQTGRTGSTSDKTGPLKGKALDVASLATQLKGLHALAAAVSKNPLIEINEGEAQKLAIALQDIAKQYQITFNPALLAWLKLLGVSSAIYGPRIAFYIAAQKMIAAQKKASATVQNAGNVSNASSVGAVSELPVMPQPPADFKMNFGS